MLSQFYVFNRRKTDDDDVDGDGEPLRMIKIISTLVHRYVCKVLKLKNQSNVTSTER